MQDLEHIARATIAQLGQTDPSTIGANEELKTYGFKNSISLLKLQSALEKKLARKLKPLSENVTLNQILGNNNDVEPIKASPKPEIPPTSLTQDTFPALQIGVDIESVTQFPASDDYRNHEFYTSLFTAREISQAILTDDPKRHLCIVFAAKEAFKKASAKWLNLRMENMYVQLDLQGQATIFLIDQGSEELITSVNVSTSFAHPFAIAVVVSTPGSSHG